MRVLPDIVELIAEPRRVVLTLGVAADLTYFRGHFDGCAILPGVVQVAWALQLGRRYFRQEHSIDTAACVGLKSLKFSRVIVPPTTVQLQLDVADDGKSLSFGYSAASAHYSSGTLVLQ